MNEAQKIDLLNAVVDELADIIVWMSGADNFAPGGNAYQGWQKMRDKYFAAMRSAQDAKKP